MSVLGEFVKTFLIFGDVHTDIEWINTYLVELPFIRGNTTEFPWIDVLSDDKSEEIRECMCSVTQHLASVDVANYVWQVSSNFSQIHPVHSLFVCYKKWLRCPLMLVLHRHWTIYSWHSSLNMSFFKKWMLSQFLTNYWCVQSINISVGRRQMCGKVFTNSTSTLTFCLLQKWLVLTELTYSWQGFNSLGCPLMLRTNSYWCVQSLNISVGVAKYVESVSQIHPVHSLFVRYKKWLVLTEQSIHVNVYTH